MNYIYLWRSNELGGKAGLINSALIDFIKCLLFILKHTELRWFSATVAVFYVHLPAHESAPGCLSACLRWHFIFLSSVTNRSSTPFVSPHLCSAVFIFHFLLKCCPVSVPQLHIPPSHEHTHTHTQYLCFIPPAVCLSLPPCPPICWSCSNNSSEECFTPSHCPPLLMFPTLSHISQTFLRPFLHSHQFLSFYFAPVPPSTSHCLLTTFCIHQASCSSLVSPKSSTPYSSGITM